MSARTPLLCLALALSLGAAPPARPRHGYMPLNLEALARREQARRLAPSAALRSRAATTQATSINLLGDITTQGARRDQGALGNCWAWAGSGVVEAALAETYGYRDSLSIQYVDTLTNATDWGEGANLAAYCSYINSSGLLVPWANPNAAFVDGLPYLGRSLTPPEAIPTTPAYTHAVLRESVVPTFLEDQATAIANLVNVLDQHKAVGLEFYSQFGTPGGFVDWWTSEPEATIWPEPIAGPTGMPDGGHAVVIVGYDMSDPSPANHYWIVLNSWGVQANRPNGLFRMPMVMSYGASFQGNNRTYPYYAFYTIDVTVDHPAATVPTVAVVSPTTPPALGQPLAMTANVTGYPPFAYQWRRDGLPIPGAQSATYTYPYLVAADAGAAFDVVVTNTVAGAPVQTPAPGVTVGSMAGQQQVLLDPGFEQGAAPAAWTLTLDPLYPDDGGSGFEADPAHAHSGTYYLALTGGGVGTDGTLVQTLTLPSGPGALLLSYWDKADLLGGWPSPDGELTLTFRDAATGNLLQTVQTATTWEAPRLWHQEQFGLTDLKGSQVTLQAAYWAESTFVWCFDDFAVTLDPDVTQALPVLTSFSPGSGVAGDVVVLTGSSFTGTRAVRFNGVAAAFTVDSDTQITATVPAGTDGPIFVNTVIGSCASTTPFYNLTPSITGYSPLSGQRGSVVTLTGTGFLGVTGVAFDGMAGMVPASFTIVDAHTLTTVVPQDAITGAIVVTGPHGSATTWVAYPLGSFQVLPSGPVTVTISPKPSFLMGGSSQQFTATVTGDPDQRVTWTITIDGQPNFNPTNPILLAMPPLPTTFTLTVTAVGNATDALTFPVTSPDFLLTGTLNVLDMLELAKRYGTRQGDAAFQAAEDLNADGQVDDLDVTLFLTTF